MINPVSLFDDQAAVVAELRKAMRKYKSILVQAPTGFGKTRLATHLLHAANFKGSHCVFTVPRKELMSQTSDSFDEFNLNHSFIASGRPFNPYASCYVGMTATMSRRIELDEDGKLVKSTLPPAKILVVDETHFGAADLEKIINYYKSIGAWIVGLSATPWRLSGEGLGKWYDYMVEAPSVAWLIENGRLSDYRAYGPSSPDLSQIKVTGGDYQKKQLSEAMENDKYLIGDAVRHYREKAMGMLNLAFCTSIKHSEIVCDEFKKAGIPAAHIDGKHTAAERKAIIRAFARREILVLTNCELCTFGFDLSLASGMDVTVEAMSDLRPTMSLALQMQKWGRVLRMKDYPAIILDHAGNTKRFGLPCQDREWSLSDRPQTKTSQVSDGIAIKKCPECFLDHRPQPTCPECGHEYVVQSRMIDTLDGELDEIQREKQKKEHEQTHQNIANEILYGDPMKAMDEKERDSLEFLIKKFTEEGYKNPAAKAAHVMAAKISKKLMH